MKLIIKLFAALPLLAVALSANAQDGAPVARSAQYTTLGEIIAKGGSVMIILLALSFVAACLIFFYLLSLRKDIVIPESLLRQFEEKRKDLEMMTRICEDDNSALSLVIAAGVEAAKRQSSTYEMVRDSIEDEGARQASKLWNRIQYLQDIAVIAPMVGLLGTVIGMIKSFGALYSENITPRPTLIAQGVSMALITTAAGLLIGIVSMLVYSYFRGVVNRLVADLESAAGKVSRQMPIASEKPEGDR